MLGGVLIASAVLDLLGSLVRYATVGPTRVTGRGADAFPGAPAFSWSLYFGTHWGRPALVVMIAVTALLGVFVMRGLGRGVFAVAAGFSAYSWVTGAQLFYIWSASEGWHLGPGFYLVTAGAVLGGAGALWALAIARGSAINESVRTSRSALALSIGGALAAGASTVMIHLKLAISPLAWFTPLSVKSGIAAIVACAAVGVLPLVAVRIGGRLGSNVLLGLSGYLAIRVVDAVLRRFGERRVVGATTHLSLGWSLEIAAVLLLVSSARILGRADAQDGESETVADS